MDQVSEGMAVGKARDVLGQPGKLLYSTILTYRKQISGGQVQTIVDEFQVEKHVLCLAWGGKLIKNFNYMSFHLRPVF